MPPVASKTCKLEGCDELRHVYPSGSKCQYCQEHMYLRKAKQRKGQPSMTGQMKAILERLANSKAQGWQYVELRYPFAHGQTLKNLMERDWIQSLEVNNKTRYIITGRGEKALIAYQRQVGRHDNICPLCGENPRHVRSSGTRDAYCIDCLRILGREKRMRDKNRGNIHRPCSRCTKRPRHQYSGGAYSTYCSHCETIRGRQRRRRERKALIKSIRNGGPIPVYQICKERPRRVFKNSVSNYCAECGPTYLRELKSRRALNPVSNPQKPRRKIREQSPRKGVR